MATFTLTPEQVADIRAAYDDDTTMYNRVMSFLPAVDASASALQDRLAEEGIILSDKTIKNGLAMARLVAASPVDWTTDALRSAVSDGLRVVSRGGTAYVQRVFGEATDDTAERVAADLADLAGMKVADLRERVNPTKSAPVGEGEGEGEGEGVESGDADVESIDAATLVNVLATYAGHVSDGRVADVDAVRAAAAKLVAACDARTALVAKGVTA